MRKKLHYLNRAFTVRRRRQARRLKLLGKYPIMVPAVTFLLLAVVSVAAWYLIFGARLHVAPTYGTWNVIISHDHMQQIVPSRQPTVGALIKKLAIPIHDGDVVEPSLKTRINQDEFRINIYRAVPVKVVEGNRATFAYSAATTARSVAKQAGVTVYPEDELTIRPVENFLQEKAIGGVVDITPSTPVRLILYGTPVDTRTHSTTVEEMLKEKHINLGKGDTVAPVTNTPVTAGMTVAIIHNGTKVVTVEQAIATPVKTIQDASLAYGTSAVRQAGSPGQQLVTYKITVENGVEVGRTVLQTVVVRQPVTQIVVEGTNLSGIKGDMALAGIAASDYSYVDYIVSHESGWCPTKAQGQYGSCPAYAGYVPPYGGYGLCQSTPGSKMASAGDDWATNPITQLRWCSSYAHSRYGSWYNAYTHWLSHHNW